MMKSLRFNDLLLSSLDSILFKGAKVVVAFSGGKDSLSLLDYLMRNRSSLDIEIYAIHINHNLRDDSINDENFCIDYCDKNSINLIIKSVTIDKLIISKIGIEGAAREARYTLFDEYLSLIDGDFIFTAHTLDDQLESFFIDVMTGVSIYTLGGIWERKDKVFRPMLSITSDEVNEYLINSGLEPIFDSSNNDKRFIRNRVRSEIISLIKKDKSNIINSILNIQRESRELNSIKYSILKHAILIKSNEYIELDREIFINFDYDDQVFLLGKIFSQLFRFGRNNIEESLKILRYSTSRRINLPDSYVFESSYSKIYIYMSKLIELPILVKEAGISEVLYLDKRIYFDDILKGSKLIISGRERGDKIGSKKLKDILIDKRIPLIDRDRLIIVREFINKKIIFVENILANKMIKVVDNSL